MKVKVPSFVKEIISKFESKGFKIYIIGGAVRDILLGKMVEDWDFATNATPEQILKLFPKAFYDNVFGTVGIVHPSSPYPYEITTFRKEFSYKDKRHPEKIKWGKSLREDVKRRDFTINAMALKRIKDDDFSLIDYFDGQKDLQNKLIRTVGNPQERFSEDALRLMRAVRIATQLDFQIEQKTFEAIKKNAALIREIAKERIKIELFKILSFPSPERGIILLKETKLLHFILPELERCFGVEQKSPQRHHIYDVGTHLLLSLKYVSQRNKDPIVRFATLIHDIGKPLTFKKNEDGVITFYNHEVLGERIASKIATRLRFSKKEREKLKKLVRWHQFTVDERQKDSAIRRFIRNVGKENVLDILDLRVGDRLGGGAKETSWRLEKFKKRLIEVQKQPFSVKDLKVNGNDVMEILGIGPGPKVGEILNHLFDLVITKKISNTRQELINEIKKLSF